MSSTQSTVVETTADSTLRSFRNIPSNKVCCEWEIKGLKTHFDLSPGLRRQIISPTFDDNHWRLVFQPRSDDPPNSSHCSLTIEAQNPGDWLWDSAFCFIAHIQLGRSKVLVTKSNDYQEALKGEPTKWTFHSMGSRNEVYFDNDPVKTKDAFSIVVLITKMSKIEDPSLRPYPSSLSRGLIAMLDDPDATDVAFSIKSKRGSTRIIYANANILIERSDYFKDLLEGQWKESEPSILIADQEALNTPQAEKPQILDLLEDSDADVEETLPSGSSLPPAKKKRRIAAPVPKRQVVIEGVSYITSRALIEYLLTDRIFVSSLLSSDIAVYYDVGSDDEDEAEDGFLDMVLDPLLALALEPDQRFVAALSFAYKQQEQLLDWSQGRFYRPCSPKSLYALADRYNLPKLKQRCKEEIIGSVESNNVLWELLSPFSLKHKDIFDEQIQILVQEWGWIKCSDAAENLHLHPEFGRIWTAIVGDIDMT